MSENILYEGKDQMYPDYSLKVVQLKNPRHAKLMVSFKDETFYSEIVPVSYSAPFGADVMDIQSWGHIACVVTDKHRKALESQDPGTY